MQRYDSTGHTSPSSANAGQEQRAAADHARGGDGEPSASSPEYAQFSQERDDVDVVEDPHMALTSQTLNADGTPKRPMNAFMIFARKRRPQISAANQMMRTGDISKILSKEWNTMEMSEKKFYLDQAKKLKDNFNSKYPDYVYRRRPNNSRKKRRPDADPHSPTDPSLGDDDASLGETSPTEEEVMRDSATPSYGFRSPTGGYGGTDSLLSSQQTAGYAYMSDFSSAGHFGQSTRIPTLPSSENPMSTSGIPPLRIPSLAETAASAQGHSYSASYQQHTSPQSASHNNQSFWDPSRAGRTDQNRPPASQWPVLPALDTSVTRQRSGTINTLSSRSDAFPSHVPSRPWSSSASSATSSSSGASGTHYSNPPFPTLASSYYPAQSPTQRTIDAASSPTAHPGGSPEYFSSTSYHRSSVRHGGADQGGFAGSPTLPTPTSPAYLTNPSTPSQWSAQYGRTGPDRGQPNLHPISTYPLPPAASSASPPPSSSGTQASQMEYWNRR
ncbi:hypothetical protein BDY19DRAFT_992748 [Irpex rosettiformis]|uniref:Uncharacterized protein n=1 Tax=Irpex rosettiformis TaxID=378272 RepID=A0ACB8U6P4_9APHY|nr:hypothetical protein BDY19DRAFT_992748 [Irpex rosettiformis]